MEEAISGFSKNLGAFCNHLQSSCDALRQSMDRRPIPLDSASSTFIQGLNRRVSSATTDLNLLESMAFGTVSFEELLGHCYQVFNKNQSDLLELEDLLKTHGYVPQLENDDDPLGLNSAIPHSNDRLNTTSSVCGSAATVTSVMKNLEEDPLLDDSLNLKKFGLSDVCLATLASEANSMDDKAAVSFGEQMECNGEKASKMKVPLEVVAQAFEVNTGESVGSLNQVGAPRPVIKLSKDDYKSLPSYMTSLASWEDLLTAVEKINSSLSKKENTKGYNYFYQDEITSLDLGPKGRAYLLLLVRMNHLAIETIDGHISYRVL